MKKIFVSTLIMISLCGCLNGSYKYIKPDQKNIENSIVVDMSKDEVWDKFIPALGKEFFMINIIDRDSGFISVTYSGSSESYIDCGCFNSTVEENGMKTLYKINIADSFQNYMFVYESNQGRFLHAVLRTMGTVEGRMNLIVESLGPKKTRITACARYVVEYSEKYSGQGVPLNIPNEMRGMLGFNTNGTDQFIGDRTGTIIECRSNGALEKMALSLLK